MPIEWVSILSHPSVKDKAGLLYKLKNEYTIEDVHDLAEYQSYENWMAFEDHLRNNREQIKR